MWNPTSILWLLLIQGRACRLGERAHLWGLLKLLNSVARGQEFVFDTQGQDASVQWILSLLEASSSCK